MVQVATRQVGGIKMAQGIEVPQTTPNAPQFQVPTDLVNAYLARKQNEQKMFLDTTGNLGSAVNEMRQQKVSNQLNALAAYASIAKAVGPDSANQVAGGIPNMPSWPNSSAATTQPGAVAGQQPSAQANPNVLPVSSNPQQTSSPYIEASLANGHPDITGYQQRMGQLNQQMNQFANKGDWGREQAQQVTGQIQGVKAEADMAQMPLSIAEKEASIRASNAKFASPQQGEAIASGQPGAVAEAYGGQAPVEAYNNAAQKQMEVKKTIAGEVSKQSQDTQNITQLKTLAANLQVALEGHNSGILGNQAGSLYQVSGGRIGSASAAAIQNSANPLATALNTELARRFNSGEVQLLSNSLIPQPKDTPAYAQQKLANLNRLLDSMATGNETNVKNVAAAITSGAIPSIGKSKALQLPQGRITVISPTGQVGYIPQSQLKEALAEGYKQQ